MRQKLDEIRAFDFVSFSLLLLFVLTFATIANVANLESQLKESQSKGPAKGPALTLLAASEFGQLNIHVSHLLNKSESFQLIKEQNQ